MGKIDFEFLGKCLLLQSLEKVLGVQKRKKILVVGDLHIGYEESLNKTGVFVSRKMYEEMIEYFDGVFDKIGGGGDGKVDKIVLLGDVKHVFGRVLGQEWSEVLGLFEYLGKRLKEGGEIVVIKGNHDKIIEPILRKVENVNVRVLDYFVLDDICFLHGDREFDKIYDKEIRYWILGHGHPAVKISDGVKVESYKCYLIGGFKGREVVIVPSFFDYNMGSDPRENDLGLAWDFDLKRFEVKVVGGMGVLDFGLLGGLR